MPENVPLSMSSLLYSMVENRFKGPLYPSAVDIPLQSGEVYLNAGHHKELLGLGFPQYLIRGVGVVTGENIQIFGILSFRDDATNDLLNQDEEMRQAILTVIGEEMRTSPLLTLLSEFEYEVANPRAQQDRDRLYLAYESQMQYLRSVQLLHYLLLEGPGEEQEQIRLLLKPIKQNTQRINTGLRKSREILKPTSYEDHRHTYWS